MKLVELINEVEDTKAELENNLWQFVNSKILYKCNYISGESITLVQIVTNDIIPDFKVCGIKSSGKEFIDNYIDEIQEKSRVGEEYSIEEANNILIEKNTGTLDEYDTRSIIKLMKLYNREISEINDSM